MHKINTEIAEYNASLGKRIKSIEGALNGIKERRNEQVRQIHAEYKAFERTYHEAMKQLERNDKESVRLGETLLAEMEQQSNCKQFMNLGMKGEIDKETINRALQRSTRMPQKDRRVSH